MKIISGKYKGRILDGFTIVGTRPTMDRVKESLFGMIQNEINDSVVLDLFSGSGNLGIEAISEGAKYAYLVDNNKKAINTIKKNIENISITNCSIVKQDYIEALNNLATKEIIFDIIFLDPPYKTDYIKNSIEIIIKKNLIKNEGIIVCESDSVDKVIYNDHYKKIKEKRYGDKYIVILKKI